MAFDGICLLDGDCQNSHRSTCLFSRSLFFRTRQEAVVKSNRAIEDRNERRKRNNDTSRKSSYFVMLLMERGRAKLQGSQGVGQSIGDVQGNRKKNEENKRKNGKRKKKKESITKTQTETSPTGACY